jgi:hypothetical protein
MSEITEHHVEIDLYRVIALWVIGYHYDQPQHPDPAELAAAIKKDMERGDAEQSHLLAAASAVTRYICEQFLAEQAGVQIRSISEPGHA